MPPETQAAETFIPREDTGAVSGGDAGGPSRDDLIAALEGIPGIGEGAPANDAPAKDAAAPAKTAPADKTPPPAADKGAPAAEDAKAPPADESQPGEPKLLAILRQREEAQKAREGAADKAKTESASLLEQAKKEAAELLEKARAEAKQAVASELAKLKQRPLEAIKEIGWDTQSLVDAVMKDGTPEYRAQRALEEKLAAQDKRWETVDEFLAEQKKAAQAMEQQRFANARAEQEKIFLAQHVTDEKAPYLRALYSDREILQKAYELNTRTGGVASLEDLGEMLEYEAAKHAASVSQKLATFGERQEQATSTSGQRQELGASKSAATKPKAPSGSRALSAASASERRAAPKPISQMSPEEHRAGLIEEANEAIRQQR